MPGAPDTPPRRFLRFDPAQLKYLELGEIPLRPDLARVGQEIRVVGNDSGEKLSILAGTIARLDRNAPTYHSKGFNDFNTFYIQAASGTKGGSSGSPVIDIHGNAVALNAGARTKTATGYYLPLWRVVRALELLQRANPLDRKGRLHKPWTTPSVSRGDLGGTWAFKGFEEVRRLNVDPQVEDLVRRSASRAGAGSTTGMLVLESVVPGTPAEGALEPGDVLVRLNGGVVNDFRDMEALLDDASEAGREVAVEVDRHGERVSCRIGTQDLHRVTPSRFVDVGGAVIHELGYQQARNFHTRAGQVYVAEPGFVLSLASVPKFAIITEVGGEPTGTLDEFARQLSLIPCGEQVPLRYFLPGSKHRMRSALLRLSDEFYGKPVLWTRNDAEGRWERDEGWEGVERRGAGGRGRKAAGGAGATRAGAQAGPEMDAGTRLSLMEAGGPGAAGPEPSEEGEEDDSPTAAAMSKETEAGMIRVSDRAPGSGAPAAHGMGPGRTLDRQHAPACPSPPVPRSRWSTCTSSAPSWRSPTGCTAGPSWALGSSSTSRTGWGWYWWTATRP